MSRKHTEQRLDVREIDGPPFGDIMSALEGLESDDRLRLVAGFEPKPLYEVLERRGFSFEPEQRAEEEWHVVITSR